MENRRYMYIRGIVQEIVEEIEKRGGKVEKEMILWDLFNSEKYHFTYNDFKTILKITDELVLV